MFRWLFSVLFLYLAWRLPHFLPDRWRKKRWRIRVILGMVFLYAIMAQIYFRTQDPSLDSRLLSIWLWSGLTIAGFFASILLLLVPSDLVFALGWIAAWLWNKRQIPVLEPSRRQFLKNSGALAFLGLPFTTTIFGFGSAVTGPEVKEVEVPIKNLHPDLQDFRIAQISDLHVGLTIREGYVSAVVRKVLELNADMIAVTGDMVDGSIARLEKHVEPLSRLSAPHGVFYVTGNHEYYSGAAAWIRHFQKIGMQYLENDHRVLQKGEAKILVGGVPDPAGTRDNPKHVTSPQKALFGASGDLNILLAHRPQACYESAGFHLQLSGHTHAGQFLPFAFYVFFAHPYVRGLSRHNDTWVYVNAGTGYWGPPTRFGVPSEITLLKLVRA